MIGLWTSHPIGVGGSMLWLIAAIGCAPSMPAPSQGPVTGYDRLEDTTGPSVSDGAHPDLLRTTFEAPPKDLDPADVVPRDLLQGPYHVVRSVRLDHRFLYTYALDSELGPFEVVGRGLLRKRVIETEIVSASKPTWLGGTKIYAYSVANAASDPIEGALQILRHPVRTVTHIPRGAMASAKALRELKELGRTHEEDDYYRELLGLSSQKRKWAEQEGLDPYSTNPHVQSWLDRKSWLSLAGDLTVTLATIPVPSGGATIAMSVVGASSGLSEQLADVAPEDVRVGSREFLRDELGVEGGLADRFVEHPWYSPSRQHTIVRALARMKDTAHRDRFIELATRTDEPHEAFGFSRLALMLAEFHERRAPLEEIFVEHDLVMARTRSGEIVLPLHMDHGYWTAGMDDAEREITRALQVDGTSPVKTLILSGSLSARATTELNGRGWSIVDGLEDLWLSELDRARYRPASPDAGRILPRLGRSAALDGRSRNPRTPAEVN